MKILTILLVLHVPMVISDNDIQLTSIPNLILPIELGKAKLIYSKHSFLHYFDIHPLINQIFELKGHFEDIKSKFLNINMTNTMTYHGLAKDIIKRTEYLIVLTQSKVENLLPNNRIKRGLIDGVGKVSKWLFGTLDSEDESRYNQAIEILDKNQKNIVQELNLQKSLSKRLIENYNKTIISLSDNQEKLVRNLKFFQINMGTTINNINEYLSLQSILTQITLDCQNLITFIDNLEDAITFAKLNTLHNAIISSSELLNLLGHLKTIYKENQIPDFKNILNYYQFFGVQVTFSNTEIIFAIHVPLLSAEVFNFLHLYPIIQNHQIFIPKYPYLARTERRTQFEENQCPKLEDTFYCLEQYHPQDNCTIQLINGDQPDYCQTISMNIEEPIIEQVTQEDVLVMPQKKEKLFSKCQTDKYLEIEGPTLLKIPRKCEIEINKRKYLNNIEHRRGKPIILPKISIGDVNSTVLFKTPNLSRISFDEIRELTNAARQLSPLATENIPVPVTHYYVLVAAILVGIALWISRKYIFKLIRTLREPTPEEDHEQGEVQNNSVIFRS